MKDGETKGRKSCNVVQQTIRKQNPKLNVNSERISNIILLGNIDSFIPVYITKWYLADYLNSRVHWLKFGNSARKKY